MTHPNAALRLPEEIKELTTSFLDWYVREVFHEAKGPIHVESSAWELDWRPRAEGLSRLTLVDRDTGMLAINGFRFEHLADGEEPGDRQPPPTSLVMTTWFDLCHARELISDGRRAELDDRLRESTDYDQHRLGTALYG